MKNIILSVVAITLSIFSIVLYFFKFSPIGVDAIGYISVIATFIAVSVTLAIGFQIYQSIVLKNEVDCLKEKVKDIDNFKVELKRRADILVRQLAGWKTRAPLKRRCGETFHNLSVYVL